MSVTAQAPAAEPTHEEHLSLQRVWFPMLLLGVVSVIAGLFAISFTFAATMASVLLLGILLLVAGVTEVLNGVLVRTGKSFALHLLAAALYLIVGVFVLEDPVQAAAVLTLLLAAAFFVGGLLRIVFSVAVRFPSWGWVLLNGVVDLVLGLMIFNRWPGSSLWVLGLFVGIDLLFHGWSWIILALNVRSYQAAPST
jgi:uncharacterized membrane protein HdeD (DUF308 family)